jgi:hypothetical protein
MAGRPQKEVTQGALMISDDIVPLNGLISEGHPLFNSSFLLLYLRTFQHGYTILLCYA